MWGICSCTGATWIHGWNTCFHKEHRPNKTFPILEEMKCCRRWWWCEDSVVSGSWPVGRVNGQSSKKFTKNVKFSEAEPRSAPFRPFQAVHERLWLTSSFSAAPLMRFRSSKSISRVAWIFDSDSLILLGGMKTAQALSILASHVASNREFWLAQNYVYGPGGQLNNPVGGAFVT